MDTTTPRRLGKSRLEVTPLGFGAGPFWKPHIPPQSSLAAVKAAWDVGVRFFDTAPWYGIGRSERRLGMGLVECGQRDEFRINTKVGRILEPEPVENPAHELLRPNGEVQTPRDASSGFRVHFNYSYDSVLTQHRDSLQRLGLSSVDSLTIHDIDYGYHSTEQVETALDQLSADGGRGGKALEGLRDAGAIHAIGVGFNREVANYHGWEDGRHEDLLERIADIVDIDFVIVAGPYTLVDTIALRRTMPFLLERRIGAIIASPYAGGWLVAPDQFSYMYGETPPEMRDKAHTMQAICENHRVPLAAAALQFVLAHPAVAAVIPGAAHPEEATAARGFLDTEIPAELWSDFKSAGVLDEDAPTPT